MSRILQTEVPFAAVSEPIGLDTGLVFMGSCFAEKMGRRLHSLHFPNVSVNPFGITYDPVSLAHQLDALTSDSALDTSALFAHQGLWRSWAHHGRFAHHERSEAEQMMQREFSTGREALQSAGRLFLTFGTSIVHRLAADGHVVNNRHKMPAETFMEKSFVSSERIAELLSSALAEVAVDGRRCTLSVSPIRHWREGPVDNAASKGALLSACHRLSSDMAAVDYLPTYELMMDELRDYRFYADDMLHPSALAEDIIWERFLEAYFDEEARAFIAQMEAYQRFESHRPLHPSTEATEARAEKLTAEWENLRTRWSFLAH